MSASQTQPRLLLVGSTGRVGRLLVAGWPQAGAGCLTLVRQSRRADAPADLLWSPLTRAEPLLNWVQANGPPAAMLVLAGATAGELGRNRALAEACLRAANSADIPRVLLASSSAVYGTSPRPFRETDQPHPANPYGQAKLEMEAACAPWRARGLQVCCLRIGNVAGADALLLNAAKPPLQIDQFADGGTPQRSYIGPQTLARVIATLARHPGALPETLNIAAPQPVTMAALAEAAGLPWTPKPAPATAHQTITLDCQRLAALHRFTAADSTPARMIAEWQALKDAP